MHLKILTSAFAILLGLSLSGSACNKVVINDHEICGDKGELGASCFNMLSEKKRALTYEEWEKERFGQLCMKADAYANLKAALLKLCEQSGRCSWQEIQNIENLGKNVSEFKKETCKAESCDDNKQL